MPNSTPFIQVIVPLRLEWEPYYQLEEGVTASIGDRMTVILAGRKYTGVVSAINVTPPPDIQTIRIARPAPLPAISPEEMLFMRELAAYYLCTLGEVYKTAYPSLAHHQSRLSVPEIQAPADAPALRPAQEVALEEVRKGLAAGKTVLLQAASAAGTDIYLSLAVDCLRQGKSVLYLVPEIGSSSQLEAHIRETVPSLQLYHGSLAPSKRKLVAAMLRTGEANMVLGTRTALFLPFRNLGLVIVADEQDPSYKQDSPAPRYHAREASILLARAHGAKVVLGSATPSFESLYNADTGLFAGVRLKEDFLTGRRELVNTAAEIHKNGMSGSFSLKLLTELHACLDAGQKALLVCRSKTAIPECTEELEGIFGPGIRGIELATPATFKLQPLGAFGLVGILNADFILAKEDFRCDERAMQALSQLQARCTPDGLMMIQTFEPGHPAFGAWNSETVERLMAERRQFGYPPYTRLVQVIIRDSAEKRLQFMSRSLAHALQRAIPAGVTIIGPYPVAAEPDVRLIRISLPRDKSLLPRKRLIYSTVSDFEQANKYFTHIHLDVDPL